MRRVSSTYSFLEETVHDLLERIKTLNETEAVELAHQGTRLLAERAAVGTIEERRAATERLSIWHKSVVDYLVAMRLGPEPPPRPPTLASEPHGAGVAQPEADDPEPE